MARVLKRILLFAVPLLLIGGAVSWFERDTLRTWFYLHRLERARGEAVAEWAQKTASLDCRVVPRVLALLARKDEQTCGNAHAALSSLGDRWGKTDPRSGELLQLAVKDFPHYSVPGQRVVLALAADWTSCDTSCPECLVCAGSRLLAHVPHRNQPALLAPSVELALTVLARSRQPDLLCAAREVALAALASGDTATRVRGLRLAVQPGIDMYQEAVPLLNDPEPLVRRAALLAVGQDDKVLTTDHLMSWLHDPDPEVRRLCESALRGPKRQLKPEHIRLARLITDPHWEVRLQVLDHLNDAEGLDLGVWLRRLSQDASPAVRAAAIRAAREQFKIDLSDRIDQMVREDPCPTVSAMIRELLSERRK